MVQSLKKKLYINTIPTLKSKTREATTSDSKASPLKNTKSASPGLYSLEVMQHPFMKEQ